MFLLYQQYECVGSPRARSQTHNGHVAETVGIEGISIVELEGKIRWSMLVPPVTLGDGLFRQYTGRRYHRMCRRPPNLRVQCDHHTKDPAPSDKPCRRATTETASWATRLESTGSSDRHGRAERRAAEDTNRQERTATIEQSRLILLTVSAVRLLVSQE